MPDPPVPSKASELSLDALLPKSEDTRPSADPLKETQQVDDSQGNSGFVSANPQMPKAIDRYRIDKLIGEGGFGRVYKAYDEKLERFVAIKVPHLHRMASSKSAEDYEDEARTLAKLNHHLVVSIHDVGTLPNGLPYLVSHFIDGTTLARRMRKDPMSLAEGMEVVAAIGEALAYIHSMDIIHRDVKPANVLLDQDGKPHLVDFGLALRDESTIGRGYRVGTPAYMSPEQARGENHLVDGRSDIFSLGSIMYEMLTGRLPFRGDSRDSLLENVIQKEARPLRQISAAIPRELERICLKALAKRSMDRYGNATDFVEDLRCFLDQRRSGSAMDGSEELPTETSGISQPSSTRETHVIPRGLRSFDRHDASFFARLLPGPYDRNWIPESLLFWIRTIESVDQVHPLRVGVIYGPSGCGKSSFIRAGLIPILDDSIKTVFVEATRGDTEARLLRGIRKKCPYISVAGLVESLEEVRERGEICDGDRLLIVIDQFEQWLHGRADFDETDLAAGLRHCDGHHLQCVLLLRDDFWLAMSRLAAVLESPLKQNQNVTLVDLFSPHHARRVLADFGVAYDRLAPDETDRTAEQNRFLDRAIEELSEDGKIIPVRLSVFVEMVKSQPWELATIERLGGIRGIGSQFLEESFSSPHAPASQRTHELAVRNVLRRLLPDQGGSLKGTMKTEADLRAASGYANQGDSFRDLMHILDNELRLITPTDPIGRSTSDDASVSASESDDGTRYYQLSHDFLVPALYEWLNKKQRETARGRAELRLAEYAGLWASKPTAQFAPSYLDWLNIRRLVSPDSWNGVERKMMTMAGHRHIRTTLLALLMIGAVVVGLFAWQKSNRAKSLVSQLQTAQTTQIPMLLEELRRERLMAASHLKTALNTSEQESRKELLNRLALYNLNPGAVTDEDNAWFTDRILHEPLSMALVLRDHLGKASDAVVKNCLDCLNDTKQPDTKRLRAAMVLAKYRSSKANTEDSERNTKSIWAPHAEFIVDAMLEHAAQFPHEYNPLVDSLASEREILCDPLAKHCLQAEPTPTRRGATGILIRYFEDQPTRLLAYALDASSQQHPAFMRALDTHLPKLTGALTDSAFQRIDTNLSDQEYDRLSARKATAAALLHRVGLGKSTWRLLEQNEYPNPRSYFIYRTVELGIPFEGVLSQLESETEPAIRQGLMAMLGQFDWQDLSDGDRERATSLLKQTFSNDPSSWIHSTTYWLLRRIGETDWLDTETERLKGQTAKEGFQWYVNSEGQTMAIVDARDVPEIGYVYEISVAEVTVEQFQRFSPGHDYYDYRSPTTDCPMGLVDWFECTGYCRWLSDKHKLDAKNSYPEDLSPAKGYVDLDYVVENGNYRMATRHEWEYACRGNTKSPRYFGMNPSLVDHYYFYWELAIDPATGKVRYHPAGEMPPGPFGVFAMYDGIREWSHTYSEGRERRFLMGHHSGQDKSTMSGRDLTGRDLPKARNGNYGFRVARTRKQAAE